MRFWLPILALTLLTGCVHPPPLLGPVAASDFQKTRVIKVLDVLRDAAIDANALKPRPAWASDQVTMRVVQVHRAILQTMDAFGMGWQAEVSSALDRLQATLTPEEHGHLDPYFALAKTLLGEVQ
jgi:hypothetical protein